MTLAAAATADRQQQNGSARTAILAAARRRFLHYGYKKTTIDEVAQDAGVGKGTVYLHFSGKDALLLTLVLEVKRNINAQMRAIAASLASPEDRLRRMILAGIGTVYDACTGTPHGSELVDDVRIYLQGHAGFQEQFVCENEAQRDALAGVLREGVASGIFGEIEEPEQTAHLLQAAFTGFFPPYRCPAYPIARTRVELETGASALFDLLLAGLRHRA